MATLEVEVAEIDPWEVKEAVRLWEEGKVEEVVVVVVRVAALVVEVVA